MRSSILSSRGLSVLITLVLCSGCAINAQNESVGFLVKEPVQIAGTRIVLHSVRIYGLSDALVDDLLRSGIIDCSCLLMKPENCNLSLLKLEPIPSDHTLPATRVRIVLPDAREFIQMYQLSSRSPEHLPKFLQEGIERGERYRKKSGTVEKNTEPQSELASGKNNSAASCERSATLCVSEHSASFVIGCEGKGDIEISTDGTVSLSLSAGSAGTAKEKAK